VKAVGKHLPYNRYPDFENDVYGAAFSIEPVSKSICLKRAIQDFSRFTDKDSVDLSMGIYKRSR